MIKSPSKKRRGWIFETAAQALAEGLGYRWAVIAEISDDGRHAEAHAFWHTDGFLEPFAFDLSGTPYDDILKKRGYALYRDRVKDLFPADGSLAKIDAASYQMAVFFDAGRRPIGLVIAANDEAEHRKIGPMRDFLRLVGTWVGTEVRRRAAEKATSRSERTYRALYDNALVGLGRSAVKDGRLVDANERLAEMFGYKDAEQAIAEFVAADHYVDPRARDTMIAQLKKTGMVRDFEVAFTRKDGQIVWVRCFMRLDPEGDYIDFVGADVTERRRREREAAEQSELLSAAFNNMAQGLIVFDGKKRILAANSRAAELIEVPAKMLAPGEDFLDIVRLAAKRGDYGPGKPDKILREVIAKTDETTVIQIERSLPNGKTLQIQAAPRPGGGQVVTYADVTEHHRRETEIAENTALLAAALENMEQGLVVYDGRRRILAANARAAELLDAPSGMLAPGADYLAFVRHSVERGDFGEGDPAKLMARPIAVAKSRTAQRIERTLPDGRALVVQANPRPEGGMVVTYSDVTDSRRHEQQIAEQSNLLAATFDNMAQGVVAFDGKFRVMASNSRAAELLDVPAGMIEPGADFKKVLRFGAKRGDYGPGAADGHVAQFVDQMKQRNELRHQRTLPNGTVLEVHARPDSDGGYLVTYTDITELTRHEREVEHQSKLLDDTLSNMAQGLVAFDSNLVILASNPRACELLDVPDEMLRPGAGFGDMIRFAGARGDYGDGDPEELIKRFRQMAKDSEPQHFIRRRPDGTWLETRGYPRPDGGYVATYADITDLKRNEEDLAAQAQLLGATFD
ncbi:MAG: PAS-domain containing protein, partial [Pseudomonadota bacterium]